MIIGAGRIMRLMVDDLSDVNRLLIGDIKEDHGEVMHDAIDGSDVEVEDLSRSSVGKNEASAQTDGRSPQP